MKEFTVTFIIFFVIFSSIFSISFAQIPSDPGVKIVTPLQNSTVPVGELTVAGISTDNSTTNCQVFVDLNDIGPYQNVTAAGSSGEGDYSNWTFTFTSAYQLIGNGTNEITSKLYCTDDGINNATKYFSTNVTGIATTNTRVDNTSSTLLPESNSSASNFSAANTNNVNINATSGSVQPVSYNLLKYVPVGFVADELIAPSDISSDQTPKSLVSASDFNSPVQIPLPLSSDAEADTSDAEADSRTSDLLEVDIEYLDDDVEFETFDLDNDEPTIEFLDQDTDYDMDIDIDEEYIDFEVNFESDFTESMGNSGGDLIFFD